MLKSFLEQALSGHRIGRTRAVVCVPAKATSVERRAFKEVVESLPGFQSVCTVPEPLAAAVGSGLPVGEPGGLMLADIGAGITESAVISLGGIVLAESAAVGGNAMDDAIIAFVRRKFFLNIGEATAEDIKVRLGSATPPDEEQTCLVTGQSIRTGLPATVEISNSDVHSALDGVVRTIIGLILRILERTPPELSADLVDRGLVLTGGGGKLRNLDAAIERRVGLPAVLAPHPLHSVALGAVEMLGHFRE